MNEEEIERCKIGERLWNIFEEKCEKEENIADAYLAYIVHVYCCEICML